MPSDVIDAAQKLIEINAEYPALTSLLAIAVLFMIIMWWFNIQPDDKGLLTITPRYKKFRRKCFFITVCLFSVVIYMMTMYARDRGVEIHSFGVLIGSFVVKIISISLVATHVSAPRGYTRFTDKLRLYAKVTFLYLSGILFLLSCPLFADAIIPSFIVAFIDSLAIDYMKWRMSEERSRFYFSDRTYVYTISDDLKTAVCGDHVLQSHATEALIIPTEGVRMLPTCAVVFERYFSSVTVLLQGLLRKKEISLRNPTVYHLKCADINVMFWNKRRIIHTERLTINDWRSGARYTLRIPTEWKRCPMTLVLVDLEITERPNIEV